MSEGIPLPDNGNGVWVHPAGQRYHAHVNEPAGELKLEDLRAARDWHERWGYMLRGPGWVPASEPEAPARQMA